MLDSATILKGISTTASVINTLNALIKGTKGDKRALLLELQGNIRLMVLYVDGGAPIDKVIGAPSPLPACAISPCCWKALSGAKLWTLSR